MADITLTAGNIMRPWRSPWGAFPIRGMPLSTGISSAVIAVGQVVCLDVNSTSFQNCIIPSSLSSAVVVSTAIVGVAAENPGAASGTNTQGTVIPVWEANPNVEFRINTRKGLLNSTLVGQYRDIEWDSTLKIHLLNVGAAALAVPMPRVVITGLIDNSGDSGGAVTVRFCVKDPSIAGSTARVLAFYA